MINYLPHALVTLDFSDQSRLNQRVWEVISTSIGRENVMKSAVATNNLMRQRKADEKLVD